MIDEYFSYFVTKLINAFKWLYGFTLLFKQIAKEKLISFLFMVSWSSYWLEEEERNGLYVLWLGKVSL